MLDAERSYAGDHCAPSSEVALQRLASGDAASVLIIDGDPAHRRVLADMVRATGCAVTVFGSAAEFLAQSRLSGPCCAILPRQLPDACGLALQQRLTDEFAIATIFVDHAFDLREAVRAVRAGAADVLLHPIPDEELLGAIEVALEQSRARLRDRATDEVLHHRYASLSKREREVMALVVSGLSNKSAGRKLGICEITIKAHRRQAMRKMNANSFADLVRMAARLPEAPSYSMGGWA